MMMLTGSCRKRLENDAKLDHGSFFCGMQMMLERSKAWKKDISLESLRNMHQTHAISNDVIAGIIRNANGWTEEQDKKLIENEDPNYHSTERRLISFKVVHDMPFEKSVPAVEGTVMSMRSQMLISASSAASSTTCNKKDMDNDEVQRMTTTMSDKNSSSHNSTATSSNSSTNFTWTNIIPRYLSSRVRFIAFYQLCLNQL